MAPSSSRPLRDAILSIDWGTSGVRAYILTHDGYTSSHITYKSFHDLNGRREAADWPAHGAFRLSDRMVEFHGENTPVGAEPLVLKYGVYAKTKSYDNVFMRQYPHVTAIRNLSDDPNFMKSLSESIDEMFRRLFQKTDAFCAANDINISSIAATVPTQWSLDHEDVYVEMLAKYFNARTPDPRENICFYTECEGLAHRLAASYDCKNRLAPYKIIMIADIGGHSMSWRIYWACWHDGELAGIVAMDKGRGAGGGSERWSFEVAARIDRKLKTDQGLGITPEERQVFLDRFSVVKKNIGPTVVPDDDDTYLSGSGVFPERHHRQWVGMMTLRDIYEDWETAYAPIFAEFELGFDYLASTKLHAAIVVNGGSAQDRSVQARIQQMATERRLPSPAMFAGTVGLLQDWKATDVAQGAALAHAKMMTPKQFLDRGAAIGLLFRQNQPAFKTQWDASAHVLIGPGTGNTYGLEFCIEAHEELRLMCDPYFSTASDQSCMPYNLSRPTCSFLYIGKLPRRLAGSICRVTLSFEETADADSDLLVLQIAKRDSRKKAVAYTTPWEHRIPIHYDAGANTLQAGYRGKTLKESGVNLPDDPEGGVFDDVCRNTRSAASGETISYFDNDKDHEIMEDV